MSSPKKPRVEPPEAWSVWLDRFVDYQKRPKAWSVFIGAYETRAAATVAAVSAAFASNSGAFEFGDDSTYEQEVYVDAVRSVLAVDFEDEDAADAFDAAHARALEAHLGPPDYAGVSTGARPRWFLSDVEDGADEREELVGALAEHDAAVAKELAEAEATRVEFGGEGADE